MDFFKKPLIALILLFSPLSSYAATAGNEFISSQALPVNSLMLTIATLLGLLTFGFGVYDLARSSKMPQQFTVPNAFAKIFTGFMLLSLNFIYSALMNTATGDSGISNDALKIDSSALASAETISALQNSPLGAYLPEKTISIILGFIFLVGLYSFISGIFMCRDIGSTSQMNQSQQGGVVKKAVIHIVSGMLLMNITQFSCVVGKSLGVSYLC